MVQVKLGTTNEHSSANYRIWCLMVRPVDTRVTRAHPDPTTAYGLAVAPLISALQSGSLAPL